MPYVKPGFELLNFTSTVNSGSGNVVALEKYGDHKLKFEVERDSYAFQSHARALLFNHDEGKWNQIAEIPYPHMNCVKASPDMGTVKLEEKHLMVDVVELRRLVVLILD